MIDGSLLTLDPTTGILIYSGVYQLFPLKLIWYYILGGLGSIAGYFQESIKRKRHPTIKGVIFTFISSMLTIYLVIGFLNYFFNVNEHGYVFFVAGYFSRYVNAWIEVNSERIVNALFSKGFEKMGITLNSKETNINEVEKKDDKVSKEPDSQ